MPGPRMCVTVEKTLPFAHQFQRTSPSSYDTNKMTLLTRLSLVRTGLKTFWYSYRAHNTIAYKLRLNSLAGFHVKSTQMPCLSRQDWAASVVFPSRQNLLNASDVSSAGVHVCPFAWTSPLMLLCVWLNFIVREWYHGFKLLVIKKKQELTPSILKVLSIVPFQRWSSSVHRESLHFIW